MRCATSALRGELDAAARATPDAARDRAPSATRRADGLEALMARHDRPFANVDTAADDTCLLAFTSGTTGVPKATMHFHRDVMAACACFPRARAARRGPTTSSSAARRSRSRSASAG